MKRLFFCFIVLILCFQIISAIDTNVQVKTVPLKNVNLVISTNDPPYISNKDADEYGDVSFVCPSDNPRLDLTIFVKDIVENKKVAFKKLENQIAGEEIYVEVVPDGFEIIETSGEEEVVENTTLAEEPQNQTSGSTSTENETLVTITETPKKRFKLLGWAIFGDNDKLKEIIYYAGGVILLAIIAFFVFRKFGKRKKEIKVKKLSDWIQEQKANKPEDYSGIIREAQQKIEDAQKEINRLKNQDKIREAERKLQQDQAEIRRLRGF